MPRFKNPEEKRGFMLTTPIPRLVTSMALPSIAAMIITSLYNLADTFFVSKLGTSATGAVGVNGSIDTIIMMASSLFAAGSASYTARLLGADLIPIAPVKEYPRRTWDGSSEPVRCCPPVISPP